MNEGLTGSCARTSPARRPGAGALLHHAHGHPHDASLAVGEPEGRAGVAELPVVFEGIDGVGNAQGAIGAPCAVPTSLADLALRLRAGIADGFETAFAIKLQIASRIGVGFPPAYMVARLEVALSPGTQTDT